VPQSTRRVTAPAVTLRAARRALSPERILRVARLGRRRRAAGTLRSRTGGKAGRRPDQIMSSTSGAGKEHCGFPAEDSEHLCRPWLCLNTVGAIAAQPR